MMLELKIDPNVLNKLQEIALSSTTNVDLSIYDWLSEEYIETDQGIKIKVFKIRAQNPTNITVVVIPGLSSHFYGWILIDYVLSHIANVYHIESREKKSAIYSRKKKVSYHLEDFAKDLSSVINRYNLDKDGFYCLGDSFGAEMIIKYLDLGFSSPRGLILISPVKRFSFSRWMRALFIIGPHWFYKPFLPIIRCVLKNFRTDMKNDAPTYYINKRNVETGDSKRMKKCALELTKYTSTADYSKIKCPTYIIAASTDKMHDYNQSVEIAKAIPNCVFEDVVYFSKTHTCEVAEKIIAFIMKVEEQKIKGQ